MNLSSTSSQGYWRAFILLVVMTIALFGQGCASTETPKIKDDMASVKAKVWDLQRRTADLELRASSQESRIALLSERLTVIQNGYKTNGGTVPAENRVLADAGSSTLRFKDLKPADIYRKSIVFFNHGDYQSALDGFSYLVRRYPGAGLGPKAQFWIGEVYYNKKRFARAVEEYRKVLVRYPDSAKAPDAMLKIGLSRLLLNLADEGKRILNDLIAKYPESASADTAKEKLKDMESALE